MKSITERVMTSMRDSLAYHNDSIQKQMENYAAALELLRKLNPEVIKDVDFNFYGYTIWFYAKTMEEKVELMKMIPEGLFWSKSNDSGVSINYSFNYKFGEREIEVQIRTSDGALPPTCQVVEEEIDVPAQPATKKKVKRVVCKEPNAASSTESASAQVKENPPVETFPSSDQASLPSS